MEHDRKLAIEEMLRDLGWLPANLDCPEKKHLAEEYLNATIEWLDQGRGTWLKMAESLRTKKLVPASIWQEYSAQRPDIDDARSKAARARQMLETHIASHHC